MQIDRLTSRFRSALLILLLAVTVLAPATVTLADTPADRQFVFAYRLLQQGDNKLAAEAFDDFLDSFPRDQRLGDARYYRAMLAKRLGDLNTAANQLQQIQDTTMVPSHAVALLRGQVAYDQNQPEVALQALEGIQLDPLEPAIRAAVLTLRGLAYRAAGNPTGAEASLSKAVTIESAMQPRALLNLGRVQAQLGKTQPAVTSLGRAIQTGQPAIAAEAARLAGDITYESGNYEQAGSFYRQVIANYQSSRHFGPSVVGLLWSHWQAGEYEPLLTAFTKYQNALSGKSAIEAAYLAGSAEQALGRHEPAAARLEAIIPASQQVGLADKVLYKAARSRFALGQSDRAKQLLSQLEQIEGSALAADGQFMLAVAEASEGDPAAGAAKLSSIVRAGPDHPYYAQALFQRARLYEMSGSTEAAAADYKNYRDLLINHDQPAGTGQDSAPAVTLRLVDLYDRLGDLAAADQAARWLLEQSDLPPAIEQEALLRHGLVLIKQKQVDQALARFKTLAAGHPQAPLTPTANYYRGLLLMSQKKPGEAVAVLKQAVAVDALAPDQQVAALRLIALHAMQADNTAETLAALNQIEQIGGQGTLQPNERLWLARHQLDAPDGDARTALRYLAPLVKEDHGASAAQHAEAVFRAGVALRQLGQTDGALEAFSRTVALGQGWDLPARLATAETLAGQGQLDTALQQYNSLANVSDSQTAAEAVFMAGRMHKAIAEKARLASDNAAYERSISEARSMFKRVTLLFADPSFSPLPQQAHLELIQIDIAQDQRQAALKTAADLISKYGKEPAGDLGRAYEAYLQNKSKQARFYLDKLRDEGKLSDDLQPYAQHLNGLLQNS